MANITREERQRREAERTNRLNEAGQTEDFGATTYAGLQNQVEAQNELDERAPDRRPATIVSLGGPDGPEVAPDNREFAGDTGKALNQMVGRAAVTVNTDPQPHVTRANNPPVVADPYGRPQGEGDEIMLERGYQQNADEPKRQKGERLRVESREAKRLVNIGAAKFVED